MDWIEVARQHPAEVGPKLGGPEDDGEAVETVLLMSNAHHGPACGAERVSCPVCGEPYGPLYRPAERQVRRSGVFLFCHACHGAWREIAA
jgi:hypothetical protein